jgi:hypothetical protein
MKTKTKKVVKQQTGDPTKQACLWDRKGNILGVEVVHTPESAKAAIAEREAREAKGKEYREKGVPDHSDEGLSMRLLARAYGKEPPAKPAPKTDDPEATAVAPMAGAPQEPDPEPGRVTIRQALERIEPRDFAHVIHWKSIPEDVQDAFLEWAHQKLGDPYSSAVAERIMWCPDASWCLVIDGDADTVVEWARAGKFPDACGMGRLVRLRNIRRDDINDGYGGSTRTHLAQLFKADTDKPWGIRLGLTDDPKSERVLFRFATKEEAEASAKLIGGGAYPKAKAMKRRIDR